MGRRSTGLSLAAVLLGVAGLCSGTRARAEAPDADAASGKLAARVELGRRLFFDPVAGRTGMRACGDCHLPEHGFSDTRKHSLDDRGRTRRHTQSLVDCADSPSSHWDGEFKQIDDVARARITGSIMEPRPGARTGSRGSSGYTTTEPEEDEDALPPPPVVTPPVVDASVPAAAPAEGSTNSPDGVASATPSGTVLSPTLPSAPVAPSRGQPLPRGITSADAATLAAVVKSFQTAARVASTSTSPATAGAFLAPGVDVKSLPHAAQVVEAAGRYREAFEEAYGSRLVTTDRVVDAVSAYCKTIRSGDSAYDRYVAGEAAALSEPAKRGLALFEGKAACASCHWTSNARRAEGTAASGGVRAPFTDYLFHDTGVSFARATRGLNGALVGRFLAGDGQVSATAMKGCGSAPLDLTDADEGVGAISRDKKQLRAFKTPTLRDVASHPPYMHDGSVATLEDAVRSMTAGPETIGDPALDKLMPGVALSSDEVNDVVAFLRALSSDQRPGRASDAWSARATATRLRFVNADDRPLAGLVVTLVPEGDALPGATSRAPIARVADADGVVEFAPPLYTHVRVELEGGVRPTGGTLVPDTCRSAQLKVPVRGRARVLVTFAPGESAPATIVATHPDAKFLPDRLADKTVLSREAVLPTSNGMRVALYSAPFRTDVKAPVSLDFGFPPQGTLVALSGDHSVEVDR